MLWRGVERTGDASEVQRISSCPHTYAFFCTDGVTDGVTNGFINFPPSEGQQPQPRTSFLHSFANHFVPVAVSPQPAAA